MSLVATKIEAIMGYKMWHKLMVYLGLEGESNGPYEPEPETPLDPVLSLKLQLLIDGPIILLAAKLVFFNSLYALVNMFLHLIHLST